MKILVTVFGILVLAGLVLSAGCTSPGTGTPAPTVTPTPVATTEITTTVPTPEQTTVSLTPGPTDTLVSYRAVDVSVEKAGTYSTTVIATFNGGKGLQAAKTMTVIVTTPAGEQRSASLSKPDLGIGKTVEVQGTNGNDRVQVIMTMDDLKDYTIFDQIVPYKSRG